MNTENIFINITTSVNNNYMEIFALFLSLKDFRIFEHWILKDEDINSFEIYIKLLQLMKYKGFQLCSKIRTYFRNYKFY